MRRTFTSFQPYDRETGTELSRHQQWEFQQYYLTIKDFVDWIERRTQSPLPWTRRKLRCSTAELLESMRRASDDIRAAQLYALGGQETENSTKPWRTIDGAISVESILKGDSTARYEEAVNLLYELVSRLADVDEASISYPASASAVPNDTLVPPGYGHSVRLASTPSSGSRASELLASSVRSHSSQASSEIVSQTSHDLTDESEEAHNAILFYEPPVTSPPTQLWYPLNKDKTTSDWVLEYLRGGWQSHSPAATLPEPAFQPSSTQQSSPEGSFSRVQRTASDLSTFSEDGGYQASRSGMTKRGRPIPTIASRLKHKVQGRDDILGTRPQSSIASGFEQFNTPPSIMSGGTVFCTPEGYQKILPAQPSTTSAWSEYLREKGLIPTPFEEMDWSGRGQHAEFDAADESHIPLKLERALGHSATALVESVRCRRIRLARKTVQVSRRLKKEEVMKEVEHLQRLSHSHIIRVVGTYTLPRTLSILLYPVADYTLDVFLESLQDGSLDNDATGEEQASRLCSISTFIRCLAKALTYIHENAMKHMDIKPKNLLIRDMRNSSICNQGKYKIYVADFGIARSYRSIDDCDTESPTAYTKAYAAPEVIAQERRDQKADIFSLGAVYAEMIAVLANDLDPTTSNLDLLHAIRQANPADRSYAACSNQIRKWLRNLSLTTYGFESDTEHSHITELVALMLSKHPTKRPTAATVSINIPFRAFCCDVNGGSEPFEAADRKEGRQLYDRAMEISEADERYFRCVVEGCVKVYPSREKNRRMAMEKPWKSHSFPSLPRAQLQTPTWLREKKPHNGMRGRLSEQYHQMSSFMFIAQKPNLVCREIIRKSTNVSLPNSLGCESPRYHPSSDYLLRSDSSRPFRWAQ
ncbi:kinase-like protein [Byssothecium circinans]|uniref:Kinase-like protein n=1 Tax=Byssothecium circinans TaxID=147558 RepID=A0A6A5UAT6_9PLEO|nr:kinase-like protein [Byssothecium circinans]